MTLFVGGSIGFPYTYEIENGNFQFRFDINQVVSSVFAVDFEAEMTEPNLYTYQQYFDYSQYECVLEDQGMWAGCILNSVSHCLNTKTNQYCSVPGDQTQMMQYLVSQFIPGNRNQTIGYGAGIFSLENFSGENSLTVAFTNITCPKTQLFWQQPLIMLGEPLPQGESYQLVNDQITFFGMGLDYNSTSIYYMNLLKQNFVIKFSTLYTGLTLYRTEFLEVENLISIATGGEIFCDN